MSDHNQAESGLAAAVMEYLAEHPQAMDTIEGIAGWWITQEPHVDLQVLSRVLNRLRAEGILEAEGEGTQTRYRLRRSHS